MKKIIVLVIFTVAFCIFSCEEYYKTKQVINNSDYEVTFVFNHFREIEYTLKPHTSDYYTENASIKSYFATPPRVSYNHDYNNRITEFYNTAAMPIKIINELDRDILITAQGCMDNEPITVLASSEFSGIIYTNNPKFNGATIVGGFPVYFTTTGLSAIVHW